MISQDIGKFISALRKEKGMTQAVLAEKLNISNRTISKWENGDGLPDISILPELAENLGVSVDELLAGKKSDKKVADIKVTEVANKDNLDNMFSVAYVISLFIGIFGALLGGFYELYSIWAFRWLFYNHWEIMFVFISLFSTLTSGLVLSVGIVRLGVHYSKEDIRNKVMKKVWISVSVLSFFPICFMGRIFDCFVTGIPFVEMWAGCLAVYLIFNIVTYVIMTRRKDK